MEHSEEIALEGGNVNPGAVVRIGNTVRRPTGVGSAAVHQVLIHLDQVGFTHAPRFLGVDEQKREVLSFIPGVNVWESRHQLLRTLDGVRAIGKIVRELHDALATYSPPKGAVWNNILRDPRSTDQRLIHGDLAPWNLVAEPDAHECGVIDWDTVAPGRLEWELAYTLQTVAFLWGDPPPWEPRPFTIEETVARVTAFADGYQLDDTLLVGSIETAAERSHAMARFIEQRAEQGDPAFTKMRDEGHASAWTDGANAIERNAEQWIRRL